MSNKSITLILVLYVLFAASGHANPSGNIFRGLKTVALDPKDPKVVKLGKFVIHEENKINAESQLIFDSVLKAAYCGGTGEVQRYALVIGASNGMGSDEYFAYVLVHHEDSKELVAFRKKSN
ncbi:uncharacterized protein [Henckelia pumila]|uniref:uncharacterized protein n=1 Tax=Henckelia pumila TaxID=405737 RepID=UPI003C6DE4DB